MEVIVRQMFSRRVVKNPGDTALSIGDVVEHSIFARANEAAKAEGKEEAKGDAIVMGITEVSLSRKSFLSAASFQHTTRVLINAAVRGTEDDLNGLMENVILGRLIPAGTGFPGSPKQKMIQDLQERSGGIVE
jgi:DNA-directed RNA polymerase subunit beta'